MNLGDFADRHANDAFVPSLVSNKAVSLISLSLFFCIVEAAVYLDHLAPADPE